MQITPKAILIIGSGGPSNFKSQDEASIVKKEQLICLVIIKTAEGLTVDRVTFRGHRALGGWIDNHRKGDSSPSPRGLGYYQGCSFLSPSPHPPPYQSQSFDNRMRRCTEGWGDSYLFTTIDSTEQNLTDPGWCLLFALVFYVGRKNSLDFTVLDAFVTCKCWFSQHLRLRICFSCLLGLEG